MGLQRGELIMEDGAEKHCSQSASRAGCSPKDGEPGKRETLEQGPDSDTAMK